MAHGKVTLRLTNQLDSSRVVVLEPWTGEYTLRPGKSFEIIAEGDLSLPLEVELVDDRFMVCAFDSAGALLRIYQDGKEVPRSE
jgi:hypothetical protein